MPVRRSFNESGANRAQNQFGYFQIHTAGWIKSEPILNKILMLIEAGQRSFKNFIRPMDIGLQNFNKIGMSRILIGIFIVMAGALITTKANWIYENLGGIAWAEEHLGTEGGSRLFYKLLGILTVFLGFLVISGLWYDLLESIVGIFGIKQNY